MDTQTATTESLTRLLRTEMAAVETYSRALDHFDEGPAKSRLAAIRGDHDAAASSLRNLLARYSAPGQMEPMTVLGKAAMVTGNLLTKLGPRAALGTLRASEQVEVAAYERALLTGEMAPEASQLIEDDLLPKCRQHVAALDHMLG